MALGIRQIRRLSKKTEGQVFRRFEEGSGLSFVLDPMENRSGEAALRVDHRGRTDRELKIED